MSPRFVRAFFLTVTFSVVGGISLDGGEKKDLPGIDVVATFKGHSELVYAVAFNKDGTQLATGSFDNTIKLWQTPTGKELSTFGGPQGHQKMVLSVAISPDGLSLASGSADNTAKVWDIPSSTPVRSLANNAAVKALVLSPDGTKLVGSCEDGALKIWSAGDFKLLTTLTGHRAPAMGAMFSGNGQLLVSCDRDEGTVRFWNAANGQPMQIIRAHKAHVRGVAFNPNNTAAYSVGADGIVKFWKVPPPAARTVTADAAIIATLMSSAVFDRKALVFSASARGLLADLSALVRQIPAKQGELHALAVTADGARLLTGGVEKVVKVWNTASGAEERAVPVAGAVNAIAVTKNNTLAAAATGERTVHLFNLADGKEVGVLKAPTTIHSLAFSPNNALLAGGGIDSSIAVWNVSFTPGKPAPAEFLKPVQTFANPGRPLDLVFSPDNTTVIASSADKNLRVFRLASPTPKNFPHPNHVDVVAFHPTMPILATGGHDGKVRLFDLVKANQIREINAHSVKEATMIYALAFSPDGKQIVSGSYDASLKIWDVNSGNLVKDFKAYKPKEAERGHRDPVFSTAFSPDGKFLASGSGGLERVIKIWNVADGSVVRDLANPSIKVSAPPPVEEKVSASQSAATGAAATIAVPKRQVFPVVQSHPGWVYQLRFTSDGKYLISAGDAPLNKGFLAVWKPGDGKMLYGETLPLGTLFGMAIAPDNKLIALGAGPRGRASPEFNGAYLLRLHVMGK